jgi:hypothetical protein
VTSPFSQLGPTTRIRSQFRLLESLSSRRATIAFCILLGAFGLFHVLASVKTVNFRGDDVFYLDAGRSIFEHGYYGINGRPEANQPPGLPVLLGLLCLAGTCAHFALIRAMAICELLGLLAVYLLLQREESRSFAVATCLLLVSSEVYFSTATRSVNPCFPYLLASSGALLVALSFERASGRTSQLFYGMALIVLVPVTLMFASAGIALLAAILASSIAALGVSRAVGFRRLKIYLPILLVGIVVQAYWMSRPALPLEWPVPGYPGSYLSQLAVKSGNYPELGFATPLDIVVRVLRNASQHAGLLSRILLRRWIGEAWMSMLILVPLLLVVLGWLYSVLTNRGLNVVDWYFAAYEAIYLLWPWDLERRFFIPIAPLACLYIWRGARTLLLYMQRSPRTVGFVWLPMGTLAAVATWLWTRGYATVGGFQHAGFQDEVSLIFWFLSTVLAVWMALSPRSWRAFLSRCGLSFNQLCDHLQIGASACLSFLTVLVIASLLAIGTGDEVLAARANADPRSPFNTVSPEVEAGSWLRSHTSVDAVIMARLVPTTFHYSQRHVVWFPPTSNASMLMEGIVKHHVDIVLVVKRQQSYYLPSDEDSFSALVHAFPNNFRLIYRKDQFRLFQVLSDPLDGERHANPAQSLPPQNTRNPDAETLLR